MSDTETPSQEFSSVLDELNHLIEFLSLAANQLVRCGCSSNRIERLFSALAMQYSCDLDIVATPTSVQMLLRKQGQRVHELTRVRDWSVDLSRLDQISLIIRDLIEKKIDLETASFEMKELDQAQSIYPNWMVTLSVGGSSAVLTLLYGASILEASIVFVIGCLSKISNFILSNQDHGRYLTDYLSALLVALGSKTVGHFIGSIDEFRMVVGGIVALLPGLIFLNAVHELAQKNLVSGAAKIFETAIISLSLSFGVASGLAAANTLLAFID